MHTKLASSQVRQVAGLMGFCMNLGQALYLGVYACNCHDIQLQGQAVMVSVQQHRAQSCHDA